jgi:hypothetical protein
MEEAERTRSVTPTNDAAAQPSPGKKLRPSSVEAIREDLERQRAFSVQFIERYFPKIATRGSVEYSDIDDMTIDQADAMSYSLAKSIRSFKKDAGRARARGVGFLKDEGNGDDSDQYEIKGRQYAAALRDLCAVFGLDPPV